MLNTTKIEISTEEIDAQMTGLWLHHNEDTRNVTGMVEHVSIACNMLRSIRNNICSSPDYSVVFCLGKVLYSIAKLDTISAVSINSYPRDSSPLQYGVTANHFSNGFEHSSPALSPAHILGKRNESQPIPSKSLNTKSRWVPPQLLRDISDRNDLTFRRVRGLLNKLTPDNFEKISNNLLNVGIENKTVLKGIIILIFEKAIDEKKYCSLYANLCLKLKHEAPNFDTDSNTTTFLRLLLSKCQEEFETRSKLSSLFDKQDGVLSSEQRDEKQTAKRKMLGNLKFIGELGKLELVHEAILHKCIQQLLAKKKHVPLADMAEDIECLCQIMTTIGRRLDTAKAKNIMNQYFDRIAKFSTADELPARIRFMLEDVIELRTNKWVPRRIQQENGPRAIAQIRWEMMGPMMPPPFPFFPGSMMPPPNFLEHLNGKNMPWMPDNMFMGGFPLQTSNMKKQEMEDGTKDIFGKPVYKVDLPQKKPVSMQPKPDLFEPHYMKSKGNSNHSKNKSSLTNDLQSKVLGGRKSMYDDEKKKPSNNKSNAWNIDPFAPHYNKPAPSILTYNEEIKKNSPKDSSPKRNSPAPVRARGSANYNKTNGKENDEISLRPSFMKKRDEKSKSQFNKAEELPAKMQQFTNLTINDKTSAGNNKSNKKTVLSKNDVDNKLADCWAEFEKTSDINIFLNEISKMATNVKYSKLVAKQFIQFILSKEESTWNSFSELLLQSHNTDTLSGDFTTNAYSQLFDDIKVTETANGKEFLTEFGAMFVAEEMMTLEKLLSHYQDGNHFPGALKCLQKLAQVKSNEWLIEEVSKSKIDLKLMFTKDCRSDDNIMKEVQTMGLLFLFPHLCLKEELMTLMLKTTQDNANDIAEWIKEKAIRKLSSKQLVHIITSCIVTIATKDTLANNELNQKPEKEDQENERDKINAWKDILKVYVENDNKMQLEALYALQIFCYEKKYPKEMLLRLFINFYDLEILEEDVFLQWKEDINDNYPGKGKALFQVNNWLQWLETADEEENGEEDAY